MLSGTRATKAMVEGWQNYCLLGTSCMPGLSQAALFHSQLYERGTYLEGDSTSPGDPLGRGS